jgi:hypothetical protein
MYASNSELEELVKNYDLQAQRIKEEIFKLSWYMRGGVTSDDLFFKYSFEDREILSKIIKENIEATRKSGMPLI